MISNKVVKNTLGVAAVALILAACNNKAEDTAQVEAVDTGVVAEAPVVVTPVVVASVAEVAPAEDATETLILETTEMVSEIFTVESFDMATRTAILVDAAGGKRSVTAGPDANNLDQVKPGVLVLVELLKSISIELINDKNLEPSLGAIAEVERTPQGEKAAVGAIGSSVVIFKIEEINLEDNTFKLKGPDGVVKQYTAKNPENLTKGTVGDAVVLTVVKAVAISITDDTASAQKG